MPVRDTLQVGYGYRLRWWRGRQGREQIKSHMGRAGCLCSNEAWPWETAWARAWPLNTGEQGKAADPYLSPFDFSFIIRSIHFSRSLAFHTLSSLRILHFLNLSLSLSSFSGEQYVFSLRRVNVITRASDWWQFSMGALRQHCLPLCGVLESCSAENVCVCGRSVGLWCLLACFHSKFLQTVCEIQAATRANCSLPQTQLRNP